MKRLLTLLFALVISLASGLVVAAPANAQEYFCGKQCNGKSPRWAIPSNGIICRRSAQLIANAYPRGQVRSKVPTEGPDKNFHIKVYYSKVCQTMWATVSNAHATNRKSCWIDLYRYDGQYSWPQNKSGVAACPAPGHTLRTPMINDHLKSHGIAANFQFSETWGSRNQFSADFSKAY